MRWVTAFYLITYKWKAWRAVSRSVNKGYFRGMVFERTFVFSLLEFFRHKGQAFLRKTIFPFLRRNLKVSKIKFHTKMGVSSREISNCSKNMRTWDVEWQYFLLSSSLLPIALFIHLFLVSWEGLERVCLVALLFSWLWEFIHAKWTTSDWKNQLEGQKEC